MTQRSVAVWFLAGAAITAIIFFAALHPASGTVGGLLYLATSWALPSVFVFTLALGLAWLVPAPIAARISVALGLSFVLALNTSLPVLSDLMHYGQNVSSEHRRAVTWNAERRSDAIDMKRRPWGPVFTRPFGARVRVGSDEGCGCMYFLDAVDTLYSDRTLATLSAAAGRRASVKDYAGLGDPSSEQKDAHTDLTLWQRDDGYRALIELFDRGEKIAAFAQTGIPLRALTDRAGVGREKLAANFFENALDILLHDNFWSHSLNAVVPNYFPERELDTFFRQASGRP